MPRNPNAPVPYQGGGGDNRRTPFDLSPTLAGLGMQPAGQEDMPANMFPGFAPT